MESSAASSWLSRQQINPAAPLSVSVVLKADQATDLVDVDPGLWRLQELSDLGQPFLEELCTVY